MGNPLSESLAAGDREAFAALYDRLADRLFATGRTMLASTTEAEDVVHDLFVELSRIFSAWHRKWGSWRSSFPQPPAFGARHRMFRGGSRGAEPAAESTYADDISPLCDTLRVLDGRQLLQETL